MSASAGNTIAGFAHRLIMANSFDNTSSHHAGETTVVWHIENALRKAHAIVPASASAADFHLQVFRYVLKLRTTF
jgi:hypothetical protein